MMQTYGKLKKHEISQNKITIHFENIYGIIEIITPEIINVFAPLKENSHLSKAIQNLQVKESKFNVETFDGKLVITTEKLKIEVFDGFKVDFYDLNGNTLCRDYRGNREPFRRRGANETDNFGEVIKSQEDIKKITVLKELSGDEHFYGLGDKTGHLDKRNYSYEMWNSDIPEPHVESFKTLYKCIPFFITLKKNAVFGIFFDNNFKTFFDMGKENSNYYYFGADDGNLDYYFIYGENVPQIINSYTYLTGRTPLPQLWTLGYHQSRWSYYSEEMVKDIASNFRKRDIPCDTIHLDINYMDGFRVFTWNKEKFPNPAVMNKELLDNGFKVVTIIDPGVKKDKGYEIYEKGLKESYFATDKDGIPYVNTVWPGNSLFPDFSTKKVREWWASNQKIMLDSGVSGIWNDMNEPASFNGPLPDDVQFQNDGRPTDHREIHNIYGHLMAKATYEGIKNESHKRPFVITRACYAGTQKYATVWTGDNQSLWEHLRMSLPMLMNLGLSGFAFAGVDVGGFAFDATPELLSRWVQVGCFSTLFRNHSTIYSRNQEPWAFDKETEDIYRKYVKLRYKLIPYLYDLMWNCEKTGAPTMRPLFFHYPDDEETYSMNDEFLFGENILVAPVLEQGKRAREVYLPKDVWYDYWTNEKIPCGESDGTYIVKKAPLDVCPIYVKAGSIIPCFEEMAYIGEKNMDVITLSIYPGEGHYSHYRDDGESFNYRNGSYNLFDFTIKPVDRINYEISLSQLANGYKEYKIINIIFNDIHINTISLDGENIDFTTDENKISFSIDGSFKNSQTKTIKIETCYF